MHKTLYVLMSMYVLIVLFVIEVLICNVTIKLLVLFVFTHIMQRWVFVRKDITQEMLSDQIKKF